MDYRKKKNVRGTLKKSNVVLIEIMVSAHEYRSLLYTCFLPEINIKARFVELVGQFDRIMRILLEYLNAKSIKAKIF